MDDTETYAAFEGDALLCAGELAKVLTAVKARFEEDDDAQILIFEDKTGRQVDFDFRGTLEQILERELPKPSSGPGRPKLGVVSREVSLLPKHWAWLEQQQSGSSAALRRLVEEASKRDPSKQRARMARDATLRFMTALAGDRENYEEASRALYAQDNKTFDRLTRSWPKDIRKHVQHLLRDAQG